MQKKAEHQCLLPLCSGAVARLLEERPDYTPKGVKMRLLKCCETIAIPGKQQGFGVLNIVKFITSG